VELWGRDAAGPVRVLLRGQRAVAYLERDFAARLPAVARLRRPTEWTDLTGRPVDRIEAPTVRALRDLRGVVDEAGGELLESDVKPSDRVLQDRRIRGGFRVRGRVRDRGAYREIVDPKRMEAVPDARCPPLRVCSFDLETDGPEGPLLSLSVVTRLLDPDGVGVDSPLDEERVWMVGGGAGEAVGSPAALLDAFFAYLGERDPDVLVGWNCIEFDLRVLETWCRRFRLPFAIGRGGSEGRVLTPSNPQNPHVARVPGRPVLDGIAVLKNATFRFESYALEHVAQRLLGRGKAIHDPVGDRLAEIRRLYREDREALAAYNLEDSRLVLDIFERARLLDFAVARQRLTGLPLARQGGAVAAFDHLYLPELHAHGHVAPDVGRGRFRAASPGGFVMDGEPGLHENVLVLDFKSLYPSLIRTFRIDPMGLAFPGDDPVEGFDGAAFARDRHILPRLVEELWAAREEAKREGRGAFQRALKIQMNSLYGVLGTPGCRFFDPRLPTSITRRGHEVLRRSRRWIEKEAGHPVLYGDTDSLFVALGPGPSEAEAAEAGHGLARALTQWWRRTIAQEHRLRSALELEFETHYLRFHLPTLRHSEAGTKKRYAGLVRDAAGQPEVVLRGLEAVRSDWTALARRVQRELYRRVFLDEPYRGWLRSLGDALHRGELDDELVYRKRLRRGLDGYAKTVPPHVAAARKLGRPVKVVEYVMTTSGPEPVEAQQHPLDYAHYLERQLAPAADGVLGLRGERLADLAGRQMTLF
jgi:DNA polymerase-2